MTPPRQLPSPLPWRTWTVPRVSVVAAMVHNASRRGSPPARNRFRSNAARGRFAKTAAGCWLSGSASARGRSSPAVDNGPAAAGQLSADIWNTAAAVRDSLSPGAAVDAGNALHHPPDSLVVSQFLLAAVLVDRGEGGAAEANVEHRGCRWGQGEIAAVPGLIITPHGRIPARVFSETPRSGTA